MGDHYDERSPLWANTLAAWQRQGVHLRVVVVGWSMAPLLLPGDTLVVAPPPGPQVSLVGQIVTVRQAGTLLTHRVIAQRGTHLIMRGDACRQPDPPVERSALVGLGTTRERVGAPRFALDTGLLAGLGRGLVYGSPTLGGVRALGLQMIWGLVVGGLMVYQRATEGKCDAE